MFIQSFAVRLDAQGCHPGSLIDAKTLAHHVFGADEVGFEHQFIGNEGGSRVALLIEPEILHLQRNVGIAHAPICVVVKVVLARSHRAKRESQAWFTWGNELFNIIGEGDYSGGDLEIEVGQRASSALRARGDRIEEEGGMFRDERGAEPTRGQFSGKLKAFGAERCQVDRQIRSWSRAGNQRLALTTLQWQV